MGVSTGLGYNGSATLIAVALAVVAALHYRTNGSRPLLFWSAFVLTRALGATLANSLTKLAAEGSLRISDITISAARAALRVAFVPLNPRRAGHDFDDRKAA